MSRHLIPPLLALGLREESPHKEVPEAQPLTNNGDEEKRKSKMTGIQSDGSGAPQTGPLQTTYGLCNRLVAPAKTLRIRKGSAAKRILGGRHQPPRVIRNIPLGIRESDLKMPPLPDHVTETPN